MAAMLSNNAFSLRFLVLTVIERSSESALGTKQIIEIIVNRDWVTQFERTSVNSRADSRIANKINNITSHRPSASNMLRRRYVERIRMADGNPGFALTDHGKVWLVTYREKLGIAQHGDHKAENELLKRMRDLRK